MTITESASVRLLVQSGSDLLLKMLDKEEEAGVVYLSVQSENVETLKAVLELLSLLKLEKGEVGIVCWFVMML